MPDFAIRRVYVVADTYYSSKEIVKGCRDKGYHFVSVLKSNRNIRIDGRKTKVEKFEKYIFQKHKNQVP